MKRLISATLLSVALLAPCASAQETDVQYLPEQGDFAVGVDVVPLLRTLGGAFSATDPVPVGGSSFAYDELYLKPNVSLLAKYMITDEWGLKMNLGLGLGHKQNRGYIADDLANYLNKDSEAKVVDTETVDRFSGTLQFGAEYRLGKNRVQGIFGMGLLAGVSTYDAKYTYGNVITELNQVPSKYFNPWTGTPTHNGYRVTEINGEGPNFTIGAYVSMGCEWFVAPKVALGAEVDLYAYGTFAGQGVVKSEGFNQAYHKYDKHTDLYTPGNRQVSFGTDNIGGSLYMTFYF